MYKVFINNKPLIFADIYKENIPANGLSILSESEFSLDDIVKRFEDDKNSGVIYLCASPDAVWTSFTSRFVLSEAAGGIVRNEKDDLLIIFRRKNWDLPKGKLDYNETAESAAVREVKEECGLKSVTLEKLLIRTFHTYTEKNKFILKKTHWYSMYAEGNQELIPQAEEDIETVVWMNKAEIYEKVFAKTYVSIKEVLEEYFKTLDIRL